MKRPSILTKLPLPPARPKKLVFTPRPKKGTLISESAIFNKTKFQKIQIIAYRKTANQKTLKVPSMINKEKMMKNYNQSNNPIRMHNMIDNLVNRNEAIVFNFILSKENDQRQLMYSESDNMENMAIKQMKLLEILICFCISIK